MIKKILFPFIAIFLAYRSYELLKTIWTLEPSELNFGSKLFLSFLLNLFITGVFAFIGFAYKTSQLLPESYYRIKNKKLIKKSSKFLKIQYFKMFLLFVFWGKRNNRLKYFNGTKSGLENLEYQTRQSEFGHLAALVVIQLSVIIVLIKEHYWIAFLTTTFNFISNFYPVLLQRNHRLQIERIKNIKKRKQTEQ
ncbi:hypothetical protein [Mesonia sp. HuA40]|uniref:glycosyl-4,4'-diaponeurosporenoate acyltransferase CrtO family protein n=1 Tax=Mesonia sp. HuA40 TaxID=2602761 RepID=UPI0011C96037|nr:hypothetical protein [Mesonia sp. HuA40]TXK73353.1 hypothetical protein FT993_06095 [Mesonia sp. HuA40]